MRDDSSPRPPVDVALPFSSFQGPIGELVAQRMLSPPSRPGVLAMLDRFEILRLLGRGGMGVVLLGRDPATGHEVAIKLVRSDLLGDPRAVQRCVKEAVHLKRLRHAKIVPVLEISNRPEGPYFVMPYFEKGSLANRLKAGQPLEADSILDIALQVAEGLNFAHRRGIIHRDLKPGNLLITENGGVCLADFGLARTLFNDSILEVESPQWEGTASYMSPAAAAGEAEDTRCDIYAFGALLYEMLTGQPPYQGERTKEILQQIRAGPPKPIASLNPKADRALAAIADGALARELRDRYAEMQDVLADLGRVRQGLPPLGPHRAGRIPGSTRSRVLRIAGLLWIPACMAAAGAVGWVLWRVPSLARHGAAEPRIAVDGRPKNPSAGNAREPKPVAPPDRKPVLALQTPWGIAADREGDVFVTDKDKAVIYKIAPSGVITNLAGLAGSPGTHDDLGSAARFIMPRGIALDQAGNLYVADSSRLRKITPWGATTRYPGTGHGGAGAPSFDLPSGITADRKGNVLLACRYTIEMVTPGGQVTRIAGEERRSGKDDGTGGAARFSDLEKGIAVDGAGNLYVGDTLIHTIRKITPEGQVRSWAGTNEPGSADGPRLSARFFKPCGLAVDNAGTVYVADSGNHTIRAITADGMVSTLAGRAGQPGSTDGPTTNALFDTPMGVALDGAGNLYVADTGYPLVRKITPPPDGQVTSLFRPEIPNPVARRVSAPLPDLEKTLPETAKRCVALTRHGVREDIILAVIAEDRNAPYHLTDEQIFYLEDQGVSENVILALLK